MIDDIFSKEYFKIIAGFSAFIILLCHTMNYYNRYLTPLGGIGVCLFLILSGYGISYSLDHNGIKGLV